MHLILIAISFLSAALIGLWRGAGPAFALVYLPALLLFSQVRMLSLPGITDANPPGAAIYGLLLAGLLAWRRPRLRATAVDYVVALMLCAYAVSAVVNVRPYRAVSVVGAMALYYGFLPYFVVRISFLRQAPPREALPLLVATAVAICVFAMIEFRLWPGTYADLLRSSGLMDPPDRFMALRRFGFFRASVSFDHPIDLGIGAALVFALIVMLAWRSRLALTRPWILGGLGLALVASLCGISFSAIMGLGFALALYLALVTFPRSQRWLPAVVVLMILVGFALGSRLATAPIEGAWRGDSTLAGSLGNRQQLMQLSWDTAKRAGPFGFGDNNMLPEEITRSVDNAYLLTVMTRGWVALGLWLALPICLSVLASRGAREAGSRRQVRLILAGFSAVVGTMVSMYTVWFGFLYPKLFMIVLALTVNESQAAIHAAQRRSRSAVAARAMPG